MRLHQMAAPGDRIAVAVSGGSDSLALLLLLHSLRETEGWQLTVAHYDHGWRADSSADAHWVEALASRLSLPFVLGRAEAPSAGADREQAARRGRYTFLDGLVAAGKATRVATGHTADDQAETVLMRVLRGSGTRGLAGILPARGFDRDSGVTSLVRPLLCATRAELRNWLEHRNEVWREDATNLDTAFGRTRMRHQIIPALLKEQPELVARLGSLAEVARAEEEFWQATVAPILANMWHLSSAGSLVADRAAVRKLPLALSRRLLRAAVEKVQGDLLGVDFAALERVVGGMRDAGRHPRRMPLGRLECKLTSQKIEIGAASAPVGKKPL
ncbi:MAG TPA: tRNA lysidine(34) synthetase TilS [Terriglobales bacterium]|nr:tRNA lysidine(34) synthetase TilS [Terriglobales bacterium]